MSNKRPRRNEASQEERQAAPETGSPLEPDANVDTLFDDPAQAKKQKMQEECFKLLARDDALVLFLFVDEALTWVPTVAERIADLEIPTAADGEITWDKVNLEKVNEVFIETGLEMASIIFTPERVKTVIRRLRRYRNKLRKAGDEEAARLADIAAEMLNTPDEPLAQAFMATVCIITMQWVMRKLAEGRAEELAAEGKE